MTGLRRRTLLMLQKITVYLHNHQVPYTKCEWKLGGGGGVGGHTLLRPHTPLSKDMPGETQGTMTVPPELKWEPAGDPSFLPGCRGGTLKAWFCPEPLTAKSRSVLQGQKQGPSGLPGGLTVWQTVGTLAFCDPSMRWRLDRALEPGLESSRANFIASNADLPCRSCVLQGTNGERKRHMEGAYTILLLGEHGIHPRVGSVYFHLELETQIQLGAEAKCSLRSVKAAWAS